MVQDAHTDAAEDAMATRGRILGHTERFVEGILSDQVIILDIVRSPPRPPRDTQYVIVVLLDYYIYIQYLLLALVVLKRILKSGSATACLVLNWPPRRRKHAPNR